tara:strand:+ start:19 stop:216 length:198 start_codon:yes stop_codon:yes gene_type:complete
MKKKHHPGTDQKTLCGHEATRQEYLQMVKGHNVTCITCNKLFKAEQEKETLVIEENHNLAKQQHA